MMTIVAPLMATIGAEMATVNARMTIIWSPNDNHLVRDDDNRYSIRMTSIYWIPDHGLE